ncbi:MAG: glucokinase [Phycisphaerae bacterium]|nr:glucokinase [Phycisphaerae bacterium]
MQINFHATDKQFDRLILAGDIGGTNTNLAIVGQCDSEFVIILECVFASEDITDIIQPLTQTIAEAKGRGLAPRLCCLSAAGPVKDNYCTTTNLEWNVDGNLIEKTFSIPTRIINDFTAISYSLPLLDINNSEMISKLNHLDGSCPKSYGQMRAVIGAGTGLGLGFVWDDHGRAIACPSEGGHMSFSGFDPLSCQLHQYLLAREGVYPSSELVISGPGITNIFKFYRDFLKVKLSDTLKAIDALDDDDKPAAIAKNAAADPVCDDIMRLFVRANGNYATDVVAALMPTAGLYLAGGIVAKNEKYFQRDNDFMTEFEKHVNPNIRRVLKTIPVYIIKDYSISLYGAANAAINLLA